MITQAELIYGASKQSLVTSCWHQHSLLVLDSSSANRNPVQDVPADVKKLEGNASEHITSFCKSWL